MKKKKVELAFVKDEGLVPTFRITETALKETNQAFHDLQHQVAQYEQIEDAVHAYRKKYASVLLNPDFMRERVDKIIVMLDRITKGLGPDETDETKKK